MFRFLFIAVIIVCFTAAFYFFFSGEERETAPRVLFDTMAEQKEKEISRRHFSQTDRPAQPGSLPTNAMGETLPFIDPATGTFMKTIPAELTNPAERASLLKTGEAKYKAQCTVCHGADGNGQGTMARYPDYPSISPFWDERYKDSTPGQVFQAIQKVMGNMHSFGSKLSDKDIWSIIIYLDFLKQQAHSSKTHGQ